MPFGALGITERLRIILDLQGKAKYIADMEAVSTATIRKARADRIAAASAAQFSKRTFIQNQLLFTMRRLLFYTTLGIVALGASVLVMGFKFNSAMQVAKVGLSGFIKGTDALNQAMKQLFLYAALTPFEFEPIVLATRRLMPTVGTFGEALKEVKTLGDALAGMGVVTTAGLNRASLAIAHMNNLGRITGQVFYQLGRDNIPINEALKKSFHATGMEIRAMISGGRISAQQAMDSLHKYVTTTQGFIGAAYKQSQQSFAGAWSTFKDLIRFASGSSTHGMFLGAQAALIKINNSLSASLQRGSVSMTELATAIDRGLTPKTHAIINTFELFKGIIQTIRFELVTISVILNNMANVFSLLTGRTNKQSKAFEYLGNILGVLLTIWILMKARIMAVALWEEILIMRNFALRVSVMLMDAALYVYLGLLWETRLGIIAISIATAAWTAVMYAAWGAMMLLTATMELNPIVLLVEAIVLLTVGLVILYFKWKKFHDLVNRTVYWIKQNWKYMALFFTTFGPLGVAISLFGTLLKYFQDIYDKLAALYNLVKQAPSWLERFVANPFNFATPLVGHAAGGVMARTGVALVGERGPELLRLPGGAQVTPLGDAVGRTAVNVKVVPQHIYLDSKKIATVMAEVVTDKEARL